MFDEFRKLLNPQTILEILPEAIIRSQMVGFFHEHVTGMAMLYDVRDESGTVVKEFERFEPFGTDEQDGGENRKHFHPFCREFRKDPVNENQCRACDELHARLLFKAASSRETRYHCHMGMIDLILPLKIAGEVRAVLFAGQRVPVWSEFHMQKIRREIHAKASRRSKELLPLFDASVSDEQGKTERIRTDVFERNFLLFVDTVQQTINEIHAAKRATAVGRAIVEVSALQAEIVASGERWQPVAHKVLESLSKVLKNHVSLLMRNGSYFCLASSSRLISDDSTVAVSAKRLLPIDDWRDVSEGTALYRNLSALIPDSDQSPEEFSVRRSQGIIAGGNEVAPLFVVVEGAIDASYKDLLDGVLRELTHAIQVNQLIARIKNQKEESQKELASAGHGMKTPIQSVMFRLHAIKRIADRVPMVRNEILSNCESIQRRLITTAVDAFQVQVAALPSDRVNLAQLIAQLLPTFEDLGSARHVTLAFRKPAESLEVIAPIGKLRTAFSNVLDNAVKYSWARRTVVIALDKIGNADVELTVEDYGAGFPKSAEEKLFQFGGRVTVDDKYARKGQGVGLVQAKEIVESIGGAIALESKPLSDSDAPGSPYIVTLTLTMPIAH